jgi:hypothetical protein
MKGTGPLPRIGVFHIAAEPAHDRHDRRQLRSQRAKESHQQRGKPLTERTSCIRRSSCPSFCRAATSRSADLSTTIFQLQRRLPCDRNYSVPGAFHRFQYQSLSAPQLQGEMRVLQFCLSHWNHKRPKNYFPLFTQDPCQHVKVVPISLSGKLGGHTSRRALGQAASAMLIRRFLRSP